MIGCWIVFVFGFGTIFTKIHLLSINKPRIPKDIHQKNHDGVKLIDKKRKTEMWNQGNSKVTEDCLKKLKSKLEHQNDLTAFKGNQLMMEY
jgi:hypothetical protein